jgi:hypothetical protein
MVPGDPRSSRLGVPFSCLSLPSFFYISFLVDGLLLLQHQAETGTKHRAQKSSPHSIERTTY